MKNKVIYTIIAMIAVFVALMFTSFNKEWRYIWIMIPILGILALYMFVHMPKYKEYYSGSLSIITVLWWYVMWVLLIYHFGARFTGEPLGIFINIAILSILPIRAAIVAFDKDKNHFYVRYRLQLLADYIVGIICFSLFLFIIYHDTYFLIMAAIEIIIVFITIGCSFLREDSIVNV